MRRWKPIPYSKQYYHVLFKNKDHKTIGDNDEIMSYIQFINLGRETLTDDF